MRCDVLVNDLNDDPDKTVLRQNVAISIFLSVTAVEAFLNIFFRIIVSEKGFEHHKQRVLDDLNLVILSRLITSLNTGLRIFSERL